MLKTPIFFFFIPSITLLYALLTPHLNYLNTVHADFSFPSVRTQTDLPSKRYKHILALRDLLGTGEIEFFFKKLPVLKNHKTCRTQIRIQPAIRWVRANRSSVNGVPQFQTKQRGGSRPLKSPHKGQHCEASGRARPSRGRSRVSVRATAAEDERRLGFHDGFDA